MAIAASAVIDPPATTYRPAATSRFLAWANDLPWHGAWIYPLIAVGLFAWSHAIVWATGLVPFGTVQPLLAVSVFYGPYILAALAYLNLVAERALVQFWPATGWPDGQREAWRRAFVTSPAGYGWAALVVGVVAAVGSYLSAPPSVVGTETDLLILIVAGLPLGVLGYGLVLVAIVQSTRQLRLVATIHREATKIDPFDRGPIYAFSRLTVSTGLAYVVSGYYALTVNGAFQADNVFSLSVLAVVFAAAIASFILPLWGIHERLVREKELLIREVERRLARLGDEMYRRVDAGQFDGTKVVSDAIGGVQALRDRISRLPTWPWPPQILRGFVSALALPVIVYIVSRLVGGRIGV